MIDNNDIKDKINHIEQGKFQNLCNKLLYNMGYKNLNQLGSQDTSDKTTPGTPDTYIIDNGLYISVECTTQKTAIYTKILGDINKCIAEYKKCKLTKGKIFYFYTSSNLKMHQQKKLRDKCQKENIELDIFPIDRIANMLIYEYPLIAKEFLNIEVDTLQIVSVEEFIKQYNSVPFGVKINDKLLYRDNEKKEIIKSIKENSITLVSGKPGVGKTHLVLDTCTNNKEEFFKEYKIFCIKNRKRELFYDLKKYIKNNEKYLLIVDDINNINGIDQILYFIDFKNVKIIATVRDYAKIRVIEKIKKYENDTNSYISMGLININNLEEKELVEILESEKGITNKVWIRKILVISQKNPRLMMMTADVFLKKEFKEDYKIEEIYSLYFENIIKSISNTNHNILDALAIISIFNVIDINNEEHKSMIKTMNITFEEFKNNMKVLNDYEIVDMIDENTAKISEQCLSNYSIYLALIKNKTINLLNAIKIMFPKYSGRLIETLNMLITVFGSQLTEDIIKNSVKEVWNKIDECNIDKLLYLEAFAVILETEVFRYCLNYIDGLKENKKQLKFEDIGKDKEYCSSNILKLISQFKYSNSLDNALQIIEEYIKRDEEIIPEVYKLLANNWSFQDEIYYNKYTIQIKVIKKLIELSQNHTNTNVNILLLKVIKAYLKTNGDYIEQSNKKAIRIVQYNLAECEELRELRNIMLDEIEELLNKGELKEYIYTILYKLYYYEYKENENLKNIATGDKEKVLKIIDKLNKKEFASNLIISKIYKVYKTFEIDVKKVKLYSKEYKIYKILTDDCRNLEEKDKREKNIAKYIEDIQDNNIVELINIIKNIEKEKLIKDNCDVKSGISTFWNILFIKGKINKLNVLEECFKNNINNNMSESIVISNCIKEFGYNKTKNVVEKYKYNNKIYWIIECYSQIPEKLINKTIINELLNFIGTKINIQKGHYINLEFLDKYLIVDKKIYIKVLDTLYKIYKNNKFVFSLYTSLLFNKYSNNTPEKLSKVFKDDYEILMDAYILLHSYKENEDYDGTYFKFLININANQFMDKYIENTTDEALYFSREGGNCLNHIWSESEAIITKIVDKILKLQNRQKKRKLLMELFANNDKASSIQEKYLVKLISENILQSDIIYLLFDIISEKSEDCRIACLNQFLLVNDDIEYFKNIKLESMFYSWSGSEVPIIESRIEYYTKINENIKKLGIKYVNHNLYIEKIIYRLEQKKKDVIRREFIEDWL